MDKVWQKFALKVAAWIAAAFALHFLTNTFLGAAPVLLVPAILIAGAVHIAFLDRTPLPANNGAMLKRGVALLMVTFAVWLATDPDASSKGKIPWQGYSEEILDAARRGQRPVVVNFMSSRCPPCVEMDRSVFSHNRVAGAAQRFIALRINLTDGTTNSQAMAEKFGVYATPTIVFLGADGKERTDLRLIGFEAATPFARRLESVQ